MNLYYKFVADPKAVEFLLNGSIKFTPIPELNDPSELTSNIIAMDVAESLRRLRREGYSAEDLNQLRMQGNLLRLLSPKFQAVPVPATAREATALVRSSFYDQTEILERLLESVAAEMSSKVGLFCVSRRFDSLPMWAHYASNATGLVVEFEGLDDVFSGDETGVLKQPITVNYARETSGVTFDPRSHRALFFEKFRDWSYEEEVRVVMPLRDCKRVEALNQSLYLYEIPSSCVSRLIRGWRMDPAAAQYVGEQALAHGRTVMDATLNRGRIELRHAAQQQVPADVPAGAASPLRQGRG